VKAADEPKTFGDDDGFTELDRAFVLQLWDDARTARLSDLYYGNRIRTLSRISFWSEILIAATATGSGIAGLAVWQHDIGQWLWAIIAAAAALLAIAKPLMNLDRQLTACTKQQQVYRSILSSLKYLAFDIEQATEIKTEHRDRYRRNREMLMKAENDDENAPSASLVSRLYDKVNQEMPAASLWVPVPASAQPVPAE